MKHFHSPQIRAKALIPTLTISVGEDVAINEVPFLVCAKALYEPPLKPLEDDPGCPEWFQFETLYTVDTTSFYTKDGVCVTVQPYSNLMLILSEKSLESIEEIVLKNFKEERRYVY